MGGAAVSVSIVDPYFRVVSYNSTLQSMSEGLSLSAHQTNFGFHACSMCARASLALQVLRLLFSNRHHLVHL